ncbi:hypothetical protein SDC9_208474 [bioreactor metagenome]|uniref:Uncharacterized protein n=1 Tax=bioreactor metagenome TaxID=1076179 RepID=A0A645JC61_9ZZZZ
MKLLRIQRHVHEIVVHPADVAGVIEDPARKSGHLEFVRFGDKARPVAVGGFGPVVDRRTKLVQFAPVFDGATEDFPFHRGAVIDETPPVVSPHVIVEFVFTFHVSVRRDTLRLARSASGEVVQSPVAEMKPATGRGLMVQIRKNDLTGRKHFFSFSLV